MDVHLADAKICLYNIPALVLLYGWWSMFFLVNIVVIMNSRKGKVILPLNL